MSGGAIGKFAADKIEKVLAHIRRSADLGRNNVSLSKEERQIVELTGDVFLRDYFKRYADKGGEMVAVGGIEVGRKEKNDGDAHYRQSGNQEIAHLQSPSKILGWWRSPRRLNGGTLPKRARLLSVSRWEYGSIRGGRRQCCLV